MICKLIICDLRRSSSLPAKHHGTLVRLYASFAPNKLLGFLKTSDEYPMTEALEECTMRGMVPERIYLLGRMGNTKAALELIMTELVDVEQAVEFCKEHDESELWDDLINYSIDKPAFISVLLNNIGTHIDPRKLVEKIEPGLKIPGLKSSLIQIIRDYNLQVSLQVKPVLYTVHLYSTVNAGGLQEDPGLRLLRASLSTCQDRVTWRPRVKCSNVSAVWPRLHVRRPRQHGGHRRHELRVGSKVLHVKCHYSSLIGQVQLPC